MQTGEGLTLEKQDAQMHSLHQESQAASSAKDRFTALLCLLGCFFIRRKLPFSVYL